MPRAMPEARRRGPARASAAPWPVRSGRRAVALALLAALAVACGYGLRPSGDPLRAGAERVFVPPLENRTADAEVGALVAAAVRRELARRGAAAGPEAPARLEGEVLESSFGASSVSGTYRVTLRARVRLVVDGAVAAEHTVARGEDVLAGQDPLESEGRRRLALRRTAEALGRDVVERLEREP